MSPWVLKERMWCHNAAGPAERAEGVWVPAEPGAGAESCDNPGPEPAVCAAESLVPALACRSVGMQCLRRWQQLLDVFLFQVLASLSWALGTAHDCRPSRCSCKCAASFVGLLPLFLLPLVAVHVPRLWHRPTHPLGDIRLYKDVVGLCTIGGALMSAPY